MPGSNLASSRRPEEARFEPGKSLSCYQLFILFLRKLSYPEKPVYFMSKALTEAQRGYMAIKIESLAVAWAMEKFHHFLHAKSFHP